MTDTKIKLANNDIAKSLSNVYVPSNLLGFDGDVNSIKGKKGGRKNRFYLFS